MSTIRAQPTLSQADQATACKSTPNKVNELQTTLASCRNDTESTRIGTFMETVYKARQEFESDEAVYQDLIITGDTLFGSSSSDTQIADIRSRNSELKKLKEKLVAEIKSASSREEQANRDFLDTREALPETLPKKVVRTLEDYSVAFFILAYLFAGIAIVYLYVVMNQFAVGAIVTGLVVFVVVSLIVGVMLFRFI